ncbi:MAG: nuclear transport factor 2 family protein, partial [Rhodothermales bacterium]|nr:nuclear transport factor 2 family protein [Rhodothermales bacterium]
SDTVAVREAVMEFIRSIDRLDLDGVANSFAHDATAFYPFSFTGPRLDGRDAIREAQDRAFVWARKQLEEAGASEPYALRLNPTDMEVRMLGTNAAIVTWHSHRPNHFGRRSATLQKIDGKWLIVSHHASNIDR